MLETLDMYSSYTANASSLPAAIYTVYRVVQKVAKVTQKGVIILLSITSPNADRFSKFFHCNSYQ